MPNISLVIFDMGNVVINIDFDQAFKYWAAKSGKPFAEIKANWRFDAMYARHERNEIDIASYHDHVCHLLDLSLSFTEFVDGWNSIFLDEVPGISELLTAWKSQAAVVILSNSNLTHVEFVRARYGVVLALFDRLYFSHEIKSRKPEAAAFQKILADYTVEPNQVLFLDDLLENIEGARQLGIQTIHVSSPQLMAGLPILIK